MKQFIQCPECGKVHFINEFTQLFCDNCNHVSLYDEMEPLKALSIKQPWAWLIVNGYKDIENRNNLKNFTGKFLIHASQNFDGINLTKSESPQKRLAFDKCKDHFRFFDDGADFDKGGIVGYATITGYVTESDSPWFVGKYGLQIKDPHPLPFTPCKGKLSFFKPEIQ